MCDDNDWREWDCIDCGVHVYAMGHVPTPQPERCAVCQWLAEVPDPADREAMREHIYQPEAMEFFRSRS